MQLRLRSLYFYTMCKLIPNPVARTVGASSEPLCSSSGIGRLAAQPFLRESQTDERFDAPAWSSPNRWSVLEEFSERIRGKGAFCLCLWFTIGLAVGLSAFLLTYR